MAEPASRNSSGKCESCGYSESHDPNCPRPREAWHKWEDADPEMLEPFYSKWVGLLTSEGLHAKADIATVLALLDQRIHKMETAPRSERPFIPEGWKLVPVEATAAMTFAGLAAHPDLGATGIWQAMYDAAPSEAGAERDPNAPDPVEHARELAAALIEARKELVEIRPEAARYRWLRERPFGADFEHSSIEKGAGWALIFCMPEGSTISANLDKSLDEAMASSAERSER